jgi:ClpP class serine protease
MASGGYLLALAGDEIYADPSSIVGSIGVVSASFGFNQLMEKIGIDRRVYTTGDRKVILDPFQPEKEDDVRHLKTIQKDVQETFVALVKERRGRKIEASADRLFDGSFWSGTQAHALGLVDGLSDVRTKMREKFGKEVRLKLISPERTLFRRRVPGVLGGWLAAGSEQPSFADDLISALETRALWSRFGL